MIDLNIEFTKNFVFGGIWYMSGGFFTKFPFQLVIAITFISMLLNVFLPLNIPLQAEATKYPFKLTITLEKTAYKLGERVNVTWTLTNIGTENITLYHSVDDFPDFIVYDCTFNHVFQYVSYYFRSADFYPFRPIAPGKKTGGIVFWKQIYDMQAKTGPWGQRVPPGVYYIIGSFDSPTYRVTLRTPLLRIAITGG